MAYTINDKNLINDIKSKYREYIGDKSKSSNTDKPYTGIMQKVYEKTFSVARQVAEETNISINETDFRAAFDKMEYPLDDESINRLVDIIGDKDEIPYAKVKELDKLWCELLRKSIKCLRYFDTREPFMFDSSKNAFAYGIDHLEEYHDRYTQFESLLYGASEYYRDHIFHAIRTWLIGIFCLLHTEKDTIFIDNIQIDGVAEEDPFSKQINFFEKLSIWTISSLCHDLGYPLEKSQQILEKTKNMMKEFIPDPTVLSNFAFTGVQDNINEYIVRFMSTKMKEVFTSKKENEAPDKREMTYNGRIQPKYYLKYTKSLEKNKHGIVSAIIIYKMLLYFIESDFNLNDDYSYSSEDARQFYIRREILRSISSHTCSDIYNVKNTTFSSLLFLCDEMQEWGRKSWNDLYTDINPNAIQLYIDKFNADNISFEETIKMDNIKEEELIINNIARLYTRQFDMYQLIFRDGQYTNSRTFNLRKKINIMAGQEGSENNKITITFELLAKKKNTFKVDISDSPIKKDSLEHTFCKYIKVDKIPDVVEIIK